MSKVKKFAAVTTAAGMITVSIFANHTVQEYEKNSIAIQKVEETILGQCFEDEWHASNMDENQLNGLSKVGAIQRIKGARTTIELESYYSWVNTVGYTFESTKRIWMNRKFHNGFTTCQKAANLAHELTHKIGFTHDVKVTKRRPFSVPYMTGTIVSKCCKQD